MEEKIKDWKTRIQKVRDEIEEFAQTPECANRLEHASQWTSLISAEYSLDAAVDELQEIVEEGQING